MKFCCLSSGSKGNCALLQIANNIILIDAGNSSLYIEKCLKKFDLKIEDINYIFITHNHDDHVGGLNVLLKKSNALLCSSNKEILYKFGKETFFICEDKTSFENFSVERIVLSHDEKCDGFVFSDGIKELVYITDTGYINYKQLNKINNKDLYLFEANHDVKMLMDNPDYPYHIKHRILGSKGHLSNIDAAMYLSKIIGNKTKKIILAHLSEKANTSELAIQTVTDKLFLANIEFDGIIVAKQNEMTEMIEV